MGKILRALGYYLTLVFFGTFGLAIGLIGVLTVWVPGSARMESFFQNLIRLNFSLFLWWVDFAHLWHVRFRGLENVPAGGVVVIANHPNLTDACYLLARLRRAVCVFKPGIRRNPVLAVAAWRAGYLASDGGPDLVRAAAEKAAAGHALILFPEGTRTPPGQPTAEMKPGFVLIARAARVPIQLVRITSDSTLLAKGVPWWHCAGLPGHIEVSAGPLIAAPAHGSTAEVMRQIEAWYRETDSGDLRRDAR
ncbi:lysophospholipid acyltransferase family protein [Oleiharenicola lentus]|uniref:lysophospholipid acyltransferase family protein n=1 Tax=Oleiharenicola lentus TaxID=2508720 RepID=UPI003F673CD0